MSIKRHSPLFPALILLAMILMALSAALSFKNTITPEKCKAAGTPVLFIETEGGKRIKSKEKYIKATYSLDCDGLRLSGNCKIRGRGNTTWNTRELFKKPYLLKLNEDAPLMGLPEAKKWVLMANTADKTSLRNSYAYYLSRDVWNNEFWTPNAKFASLFVNGIYQGLYAVTEKIEIQQNRLALEEKSGSFLFEARSQKNKTWNFKSSHGISFSIRQGENLTEQEFLKIQNIIQEAEDSIFSDNFTDKENGWQKYLNIQSFADWYLINEFTKNHDARFQSSCFLYYDSTSKKIYMGPIWDFDISCGNISYNGCDKTEGFWIKQESEWFKRLFEDPYFEQFVKDRWNSKKSLLRNSIEWIKKEAEKLEPAVIINDSLWKNIGHRQWPHAPGWKKRKTYAQEINYLTSWLTERFEWLDQAINSL